MGKKKSRAQYVSKGIVGTTKSRSNKDADYAQRRITNQLKAFMAGKNVVLTIPNPNKNETNKPFIKVNAREVWKSQRR
tara:strand:- start:102 stop:335 length:234 start_codon:yes stop_codon:yes gene_type:complete